MKKRILVIGATGLIGNAVAKQLYNDGSHVIVLSRNKEKARGLFQGDIEIIEADVLDPTSIRHAFTGIDGVYISLPENIVPVAMPAIVEAAKASRVKQLVYTSGCTVRKENAVHPMIKNHLAGEECIECSGIPYTILKLTMVMDMIPRYANNGKPFIIGKQIHGFSWIHTSDIARMVSSAFSSENARNKKFTLWGNERSTITDVVEGYNRTLNLSTGKVKPKPYWQAGLLSLIVGEKLKYAISIFRYFDEHPEEGDPEEAYSILGRPQMTLESYFRLEKEHGIK
jgi:uncharacterized protein YbjT (DUF2867 family)